MDAHGSKEYWPPSIGDYVRIRQHGALGEVIDIAYTRATCRYTVNVFLERMSEPLSLCLDELESIWQGWPSVFASRRLRRGAQVSRHAARPS
jgi:hypothetical protein